MASDTGNQTTDPFCAVCDVRHVSAGPGCPHADCPHKKTTLDRHFPLPWRVDEDWTAEILAANGRLVMKLPYPLSLSEAHAIVRAVNNAT